MPDFSSLPPTIRRMWQPNEDYLCLVVWNVKKKKGIALKTTRVYVVFTQTVRKFIPNIEPSEIREGLRCLIDCGTTVHGNYLFYLAYEEDKLPYDNLHEVWPQVVMEDDADRVRDPIANSLEIAKILDINSEQFPARIARPELDSDLKFTDIVGVQEDMEL